MKNSTSIYLSLILGLSLAANVAAAKEKIDRSKLHASTTSGIDNNCDAKPISDVCKPQKYNSSRSNKNTNSSAISPISPSGGHVTVLKAKIGNDLQNNRKYGGNSSRSNKADTVSSAIGAGHVTVLKAKMEQPTQSNGHRGHDYNSSRPNIGIVSNDVGDDMIVRKKPGRTQLTTTCPSAKKAVNSQTKTNCPDKK